MYFTGYPSEKEWLAVWVAWAGLHKCFGKWTRGYCIFGVEDLPDLYSRHEIFANKFYQDYQPLVLECLEQLIEYKTTCPGAVTFDTKFYKSLNFITKG